LFSILVERAGATLNCEAVAALKRRARGARGDRAPGPADDRAPLLADECRDGRGRPTELVQEPYLRLLDWRGVHWQNRAHFPATAARMMRRVSSTPRARRAIKRGEGIDAMPIDRLKLGRVGTPRAQVGAQLIHADLRDGFRGAHGTRLHHRS
jgi:hypothetical protein